MEMDLKNVMARKLSGSDNSESTYGSLGSFGVHGVRFSSNVTVAILPWQERYEARKARSGMWRSAAISDELWDGETITFRAVELSPEEFKKMAQPAVSNRRKSPLPRTFATMFTNPVNEDGVLSGVDIVHARARVYAEDFDEEERDENGKLDDVDGEVNVLKIKEVKPDGEAVIDFEPINASSSRLSQRGTLFMASPPLDPSPRERAGMVTTPDLSAYLAVRKRSSNRSNRAPVHPPFYCGDGKRPIFLLGEEPVKFERADWEEEKPQSRRLRRKRSILGKVMEAIVTLAT